MKHLAIILSFISSIGFCQTSTIYPNFDFELGNLNNWTFSTSTRATLSHSLSSVPVNCTPATPTTSACGTRGFIIDTNTTKTITTCSLTSTTPIPGRFFMLLKPLSNVTIASYQFTVNVLAPVLNIQSMMQLFGGETGLDQSFHQIVIKDISNAVIPGSLVDYSVLTHSSVATYCSLNDYSLGWGTYTQNLSSYVSQVLKVEIIIAACGYSGHQPISYFDGYFSTTTGIRESDLPKSIQIVPNPANDFITIKKPFDEDLKVLIYDTQGRLMKEEISEKIDISELQAGLYFIRAIGKQGNYSQTFIKE